MKRERARIRNRTLFVQRNADGTPRHLKCVDLALASHLHGGDITRIHFVRVGVPALIAIENRRRGEPICTHWIPTAVDGVRRQCLYPRVRTNAIYRHKLIANIEWKLRWRQLRSINPIDQHSAVINIYSDRQKRFVLGWKNELVMKVVQAGNDRTQMS